MARIKPFVLAVLLAVSQAAAQPDPKTVVNNARQATAGQSSVQSSAVTRPLGRQGSAVYQASLLKAAADWLKQPDKEPEIIAFINDKGCVPTAGGRTALTAAAFEKVVADLSKPEKTEVIFITPQDAIDLTGVRGDAATRTRALAIGITAELKAQLPAHNHVSLGRPGKNVIALNYSAPTDPREKAPDSGTLSLTFAHEFLHIVLRQFDNEELGGGARKSSSDMDIANFHHQLTDHFGWSQFRQSNQPWTKPAQARSCDDAAKATQQDAQAFLKSLQPRAP